MKINIVRAFVLTLACVGFSATVVSARTTESTPLVKTQVAVTPIGLCAPNDPSYCGMQ